MSTYVVREYCDDEGGSSLDRVVSRSGSGYAVEMTTDLYADLSDAAGLAALPDVTEIVTGPITPATHRWLRETFPGAELRRDFTD